MEQDGLDILGEVERDLEWILYHAKNAGLPAAELKSLIGQISSQDLEEAVSAVSDTMASAIDMIDNGPVNASQIVVSWAIFEFMRNKSKTSRVESRARNAISKQGTCFPNCRQEPPAPGNG